MAQNISVPDIGDFKDVEVIEILVKPGDQINKNDPIVTIESDKSSVEIPSPSAGKIKDLKVKIGDKVSEGSLLATIENGQAASAPKQEIKRKADEFIKTTWVLAMSQTQGKGRNGKIWLSGQGNFAASVIFFPTVKRAYYHLFGFFFGVALYNTIRKFLKKEYYCDTQISQIKMIEPPPYINNDICLIEDDEETIYARF